MSNKIKLKIVTPSKKLYDSEVDMVIVRTTTGDIGVLKGHQNLTTTLGYGLIRIQNDDNEETLTVFGGFCEIDEKGIMILTDAAERPEDIDLERAERAKARAEERIKAQKADTDILRAQLSLKRALTRIDAKK